MGRYSGRVITKNPVAPSGPGPTATAPGIWTIPEVAYWTKQGRWPNASADPYWAYVSYLLGTTSTNAAQNNTFLDSSTNNFTVTRNGNTTQGSFTPYGSLWSNYFDGSGDYLTSATATAPGTGDFTVEGWFNMPSIGSTRIMYDCRPSGTNGAYQTIYVDLNGYLSLYANSADQIKSATVVSVNVWNHFALCRSGTSTKLFLNGVQQGSTYTDTNNWLMGTSRPAIGADGVNLAGSFFLGYLSNIRAVNGTAVYTSAFTPPAAPLTAVSGTSLLTCQSNRFIDNSSNAFAITPAGNVAVTPFSPFILASPGYSTLVNGGSGYFDGSGDYLTVPASSSWIFSGDYTLEAWVYPTASGADMQIFGTGGSGSNDQFGVASGVGTGRVYWAYAAVGNYLTTTANIPASAWTHIAVTRSSNTLRAFVNGVQVFSGTMSTTVGQNATNYVGSRSDGFNSFTGYMAGARIVTGTAVYTAAFTPPTAPATAITNTSLLLNFTNAGIYDAAMNNDMETVGTAQVSTGQAKFGTTSAKFASGDYLKSPNDGRMYGDFTVEAWVYLTALPGEVYTIGTETTGRVVFGVTAAGAIFWNQYGSASVIIGGTVSTNTWTHIAWVKSGTTVTGYINGISVGTATMSYTAGSATGVFVGGNAGSYTGYIDDLRITKGVARYTSNFTPPTAALPVY